MIAANLASRLVLALAEGVDIGSFPSKPSSPKTKRGGPRRPPPVTAENDFTEK
jgi:hypothetical protein